MDEPSGDLRKATKAFGVSLSVKWLQLGVDVWVDNVGSFDFFVKKFVVVDEGSIPRWVP